MEKVIKDGKVAVLVSYGFGAGWFTWNKEHEQILFSPKIVQMVEQNKQDEINEYWINENLGIENLYCGGASDLQIVWLPIGTRFSIEEFDGSESIRTIDDLILIA